MSRRVIRWTFICTCSSWACGSTPAGSDEEGDGSIHVQDAGLSVPESIVHDPASDTYLVSNIAGSPAAADDNGFISRIGPQGDIVSVRYIDGQSPDVDLSAPKGMAIVGNELWVTDITFVRRFDLTTAAALESIDIPGSEFLNDLATRWGIVYASDSSNGSVWRIEGDLVERIYENVEPPNGLAVDEDGVVWAVTGDRLHAIEDGVMTRVAQLPAGNLDGLVLRGDGRVLVSSWAGEAVYQGPVAGPFEPVLEGLTSPADIGWDATRERVLVPLFQQDALMFAFVP